MSQSYRKTTAKKLQEIINTATDPKVIIEASNALAKYLPKPRQVRRRRGTPLAPIKAKELSVDEMVLLLEKKRKGKDLSEAEQHGEAENGGSAEVG